MYTNDTEYNSDNEAALSLMDHWNRKKTVRPRGGAGFEAKLKHKIQTAR